MLPSSFLVLIWLLPTGISCISRWSKLSLVNARDFPDAGEAIIAKWKMAERKRIYTFLGLSWGALALQIAFIFLLRILSTVLSDGGGPELEDIATCIQLGFLCGSVALAIAWFGGEGAEQKKFRVEAKVKSFYCAAKQTRGGEMVISAEPFAAQVEITHVLGEKWKSHRQGFLGDTRVMVGTKTYRVLDDLSPRPPDQFSVESGKVTLGEGVYFSCRECGELVAAHLEYSLYLRLSPSVIRAERSVRKSLMRYVLFHRLGNYWIAAMFTSMLMLALTIGALHGRTSSWSIAGIFLLVDAVAFGIYLASNAVFVGWNIEKRETLLRLPVLNNDAKSMIESGSTAPVLCVSRIEIESSGKRSHELRAANRGREVSWGTSWMSLYPRSYGCFGLINPYIPNIWDWE